MNLKKLYLLIITLVFSLSAFSQYYVLIGVKNYTSDGYYTGTGHIYNNVTLATQSYQFNITTGPSGGGQITINVNDPNWELKDLRVTHQSYNLPVSNFSNYPNPLNVGTYDLVYRPNSGNNKVTFKWGNNFDGSREYQFIITAN